MQRDEAHVWILELDRHDAGLEAVLSAEERRRAARFRLAHVRRRFIAAHGQLRIVLSGYLDRAPERIVIRRDRHGKPTVPGISFNLSHSGTLALAAIGTRPLGVDIERSRPRPAAMRLAGRYFSDPEIAGLKAEAPSRRLRAFYACWTRKEAVVKALGMGLRFALDRFAVSVDPGAERPALRWIGARPRGDWKLRRIDVPAGYEAAIAIDASVRRLRVRKHAE